MVVIVLVAADTGAWGVVVISVMTGCTLIGNQGMRSVEGVIIVVNIKRGRVPVWFCCMACGAFHRDGQCDVIRIEALIKIRRMARYTLGGSSGIPIRMTIQAIDHGMCAGKGEAGIVVIKTVIALSVRMAGEASRTIVRVSIHTDVIFICLLRHMTGYTGKLGVIARGRMAIRTLCPYSLVGSAIDREMLGIMIKCGGFPGCFCVACRAVS